MHPVVITQPYQFVPPYLGRVLPWLMQQIMRPYLRRNFGITGIHCEGVDILREQLAAGAGVLLAPNHCRPKDPLVVSELCRQSGTTPIPWPVGISSCRGGSSGCFRELAVDSASIARDWTARRSTPPSRFSTRG
jgi:hypothetical protein